LEEQRAEAADGQQRAAALASQKQALERELNVRLRWQGGK